MLSALQLEERAAAAAAANEEATGSGEAGPTPAPPVAGAKAAPAGKVTALLHLYACLCCCLTGNLHGAKHLAAPMHSYDYSSYSLISWALYVMSPLYTILVSM